MFVGLGWSVAGNTCREASFWFCISWNAIICCAVPWNDNPLHLLVTKTWKISFLQLKHSLKSVNFKTLFLITNLGSMAIQHGKLHFMICIISSLVYVASAGYQITICKFCYKYFITLLIKFLLLKWSANYDYVQNTIRSSDDCNDILTNSLQTWQSLSKNLLMELT